MVLLTNVSTHRWSDLVHLARKKDHLDAGRYQGQLKPVVLQEPLQHGWVINLSGWSW